MADRTPVPLPIGAVVDYHGSHKHGRYVITGHEAPRPGVPDPEINYPDGVAYTIWPIGVPQKFGNRHHMISQVRRQSLTPVSGSLLPGKESTDD